MGWQSRFLPTHCRFPGPSVNLTDRLPVSGAVLTLWFGVLASAHLSRTSELSSVNRIVNWWTKFVYPLNMLHLYFGLKLYHNRYWLVGFLSSLELFQVCEGAGPWSFWSCKTRVAGSTVGTGLNLSSHLMLTHSLQNDEQSPEVPPKHQGPGWSPAVSKRGRPPALQRSVTFNCKSHCMSLASMDKLDNEKINNSWMIHFSMIAERCSKYTYLYEIMSVYPA